MELALCRVKVSGLKIDFANKMRVNQIYHRVSSILGCLNVDLPRVWFCQIESERNTNLAQFVTGRA
jgi:hypothetical protein